MSGTASFSMDQIEELAEAFKTVDANGNGQIDVTELKEALRLVGYDMPGYEIRKLSTAFTSKGFLTMEEFSGVYEKLKRDLDIGGTWKAGVKQASEIITIDGLSEASQAMDIKHSLGIEEQIGFAGWINTNMGGDPTLKNYLPISTANHSQDLYTAVSDGVLLCKLINYVEPGTIDERAIELKHKRIFTKQMNQNLAINSARSIGCTVVNIGCDDLLEGKQHLVLGLLWQLIRKNLFSGINLNTVPGLVRLLRGDETLAQLMNLSPEEILMRWVNYHMEQAGVDRRITNFTNDIKDSFIYTHLIDQIAPEGSGVTRDALTKQKNLERATQMLREADKIDCREFVTPQAVDNGIYKLNLAFVANMFNKCPGLKPPGEDEDLGELEEIEEETADEKTYRNWMNSMGVDPYVNHLYNDLKNGVIIFQLYDICKPGIVNWKQVVVKFRKISSMMDQIGNCNYAVDLGKQLRFSLVGIQGKDIYDENKKLTLALVWQIMRAYTLAVLGQCTHSGTQATDKDIIDWTNTKLASSGKTRSIRSFQDVSIQDSLCVADLVDCIQPGVIDYELLVEQPNEEQKEANAKYAITCARKIGAKVYALPEHIVNGHPKMVMTVFACLMARDYMPDMGVQKVESTGVQGRFDD